MKKQWWLAALALVASASAFADPGVMIGVNYNFDGQLGITLKVLTTDKQDRPALGVGVSYLPMRKSFGFDADVAYLFKDYFAKIQLSYTYTQKKYADAAGAMAAMQDKDQKQQFVQLGFQIQQ